MSEPTEKIYKAVDENDVSEKINKIVDQLVMQEGSRELVNGIVKELKEDYGLNPTVIRQTASIIHKHNKEEVEEKNTQVQDLLSFCR
jgi:hypothetical protein